MDYNGGAEAVGAAAAGVFMILYFVFIIAIYVYMALVLMKLAQKTGTDNGWFAFIPILNCILMLQIAAKPVWWIILFFIPFVNFIMAILVWMSIAEAVGKPGWWGAVGVLIPIVGLILFGIMAFGKSETYAAPSVPTVPPPPPAL